MNKQTSKSLISSFYALSGIFFLFSSTRTIYFFSREIEWIMLYFLVAGIAISLRVKAIWIAYYHFILILFYNPLILSKFSVKDSLIADIVIGILFFFIGLHWDKFVKNNN